MNLKLFIGLIFLCTIPAKAEFRSVNYLGLNYTDNANLEKDQTDADFFTSLLTANSYSFEKWKWRFRLAYSDYAKENQNDVLKVQSSVHYLISTGPRATELYFTVRLQNYLRGQASGTTDTSFDYFGFEMGTEHSFELKGNKSFKIRPSYQQKSYSNLNGRKDQEIGAVLTVDKEIREKTYIYGDFGLSFLSSSLSEYSKNIFLFGTGIDYKLDESWNLEGDLSFQSATYTSRVTTQNVAGSNRRKGPVGTETVPETTGTLVLNLSGTKKLNDEISFHGGWTLTSQGSRSGDESYSADLIYCEINDSF